MTERSISKGVLVALLFATPGLPVRAQEEADPPPQSTPEIDTKGPSDTDDPQLETGSRYHFLGDKDAILSAWLGSGLAERLELGESAGGRELFGVQFGGRGTTPLADRTTILLIGGLDGISLAGSEAVLEVTNRLLDTPEKLPAEVTFVSIPWANPDGLARWLALGCGRGGNDRISDDDEDGQADEDGPDDLDGDGVVLEMLIEDPEGDWVHASDPRFLRPARDGEAPRYRRMREGKDDDGDGAYNEDAPGGVVLDLNFPVGWSGSWSGLPSGPWPLSEPVSRTLAEFALARRTALVLLFQGNHGRLAAPGGVPHRPGVLELPFPSDLPTYQQLVEAFSRTSARDQEKPLSVHAARQESRPGAAVDWFYTALGALAMEVSVWGPDVEGEIQDTVDAQFLRDRESGEAASNEDLATGPAEADRAWARWLDDTRGGLGFVNWHPVELGDGQQGWVGGWEPKTCFNPPPDVLPLTLSGLDAFTLELAQSLPQLEIDVLDQRRDGRVTLLRARIKNHGRLASGAGPDEGELGAVLRLELPQGVQLLAGELEVPLGHLPGQGTSPEYRWLVVAPDETLFKFTVTSTWSPTVLREVIL